MLPERYTDTKRLDLSTWTPGWANRIKPTDAECRELTIGRDRNEIERCVIGWLLERSMPPWLGHAFALKYCSMQRDVGRNLRRSR